MSDVRRHQRLVDALPALTSSRPLSSNQSLSCRSVITQPGTSVLTRMLNGPSRGQGYA